MTAIIFSFIAFFSTLMGGLASIKFRDKLHLILGFTAGVILGLVSFDLLPEIFELVSKTGVSAKIPMIALVVGFMTFHILEKFLLVHDSQEEHYGHHHHPTTGVYSALALAGHSFFDGMGIGLAFQVSNMLGILIAVAVIGHDFSDGLNTGALMLMHKNDKKNTLKLILIDAAAPILGAFSTLFFHLSESTLLIYLGFFAGFLLYIGLEEILPEAHSKNHTVMPVFTTFAGLIFIYIVTNLL